MRQNAVTDVDFMKKIWKQAVTYVYLRKYLQSFKRLLAEFRDHI